MSCWVSGSFNGPHPATDGCGGPLQRPWQRSSADSDTAGHQDEATGGGTRSRGGCPCFLAGSPRCHPTGADQSHRLMNETSMPTNLGVKAKPSQDSGWLAHNDGAVYCPDSKATSSISNPHWVSFCRQSACPACSWVCRINFAV